VTARVDGADALFAPLAARQILRSREIDVRAAQNDALLATAVSYFNVQQARGRLAATQDVVDRALALRGAINLERVEAARPTDLHRARALLAGFEDDLATAREQWRVASADFTEVLRLDPTATVAPLEPPDLRVTLISPQEPVDALIPIGLTARPELASQQALVQAALARIKQERLRPLVPSLVLQGGPGAVGPGGFLMGGVFASDLNGAANPTQPRDDVSVGLVWELQNLGLGNRALVRERQAEQKLLLIDLFRIQDQIAADIARAHARLASAVVRVGAAEAGLQEARQAYEGALAELQKPDAKDNLPTSVRRAFDVIDALRALSNAYDRYFQSANDYNRAQFQLYRALGYPAGAVACEHPLGPILPVDTSRPPPLPPVGVADPGPGRR
jgi:outer membrane protein TolC